MGNSLDIFWSVILCLFLPISTLWLLGIKTLLCFIYIHTHTHTHISIHMCVCIYIYVCIYVMDIFIFIHTYVCVCIYLRGSLDSDNANFSLPFKYYFILENAVVFFLGWYYDRMGQNQCKHSVNFTYEESTQIYKLKYIKSM